MPKIHPEIQHAIYKVQRKVEEIQQTLEDRGDNDGRNRAVSDSSNVSSPVNIDHDLDSEQVSRSQMLGNHLLMFILSLLGESPPPPPRACFGRDELVESIVGLAGSLNPVALIGPGGIGKTSVALTVLHHHRLKERFGDNRRFIRCDQFTASQANFLNRLSRAIGAGIKNAEDLTTLRSTLSSTEMLIVLDNAESILDPLLTDGEGIYNVVEELSQFANICLLVTSRITTIPSTCETLDVPTLPIEAARDTFYRIYKQSVHSDLIDGILQQLDFHPLSITLLATVAHQNKWDSNRLTKEWEKCHTSLLQTEHNRSLGAAIELSLSSPMFVGLGSHARELLGIIAFFPRGVNEDHLDWLFPTVPNVATILDKFRMLSLTYRSDGFITMLVPLRDYLRPKDPLSSPLFCAIKESYFLRLLAKSDHFSPGSKETRWIISEDENVEHLLDVLTSIDANLDGVWRACLGFMDLLYWHKPRRTALGPKIEQLPDDHLFKFDSLWQLARLLDSIGNHAEQKRLLDNTLELERERGNEYRMALTLMGMGGTNWRLGLVKEGIDQAKEASEIFERIGDVGKQVFSLLLLAFALLHDNQLDAAEGVASRAFQLLPGKGEEFLICQSHSVLGNICRRKGEREKAIHHFKTVLDFGSRFEWDDRSFSAHELLANLYYQEDKFDNALAHIEKAKSYAVNDAHSMGQVTERQAQVYYRQHKLEEATFEALRAVEIFERLGAQGAIERCRAFLQLIEETAKSQDTSAVSFQEFYHIPHLLTLLS